VSPVTKGLDGRPSTTAQDNDFRRAAILPGGDWEIPAVGGHDPDDALDNQGAIGLGGDNQRCFAHGGKVLRRRSQDQMRSSARGGTCD
jgi:hypothetical protein